MRAFLLLLLPVIAACQDPASWQAFPVGGIWCGAVMRAVDRVQVYCYDDTTNKVIGTNHLTRPLRQDFGYAITLPVLRGRTQYEVGDPYMVPIGGIRWEFYATPTGIHWTIRLASPGGADVITVIPKSYSGIFTKIYGQ